MKEAHEMPLTLEEVMKLFGYKERSPGNEEELNTLILWTEKYLEEKGEAWIKKHQQLFKDQWECIFKLGL